MTVRPYTEVTQRNARRWDAMAKYRPGMTVDQHRAGVSALEPEELDLLGNLHGIRVLHLACAVCDEGITMAILGAQVTGVDISPTHIRAGREKAAALGVDLDLRVGDMMALDDDLRDFDLVYISSGGICWVPDLDDWLTGVRGTLRSGGRILIAEHHPFWETMGVRGDRQLTVLRDSFGATTLLPAIADPTKHAIGTAETSDNDNTLQSFVWNIGALTTALIRNDFTIRALLELPYPDMYPGLGDAAACVPAVYRLMAEGG